MMQQPNTQCSHIDSHTHQVCGYTWFYHGKLKKTTCPKCSCQWQSPPDNWTKNWQEDTKEAKENEE